jgi:hypothetical protein
MYIKNDRETDSVEDWLPSYRYIGRQAGQQADRPAGRQASRQAGRKTGRQTYRPTNRKTERQTSKYLSVLYCTFLLYSKYSMFVLYPHMVLTALYYTGWGLRGTLGPKSSYFCTESVFKCALSKKIRTKIAKIKKFVIRTPCEY